MSAEEAIADHRARGFEFEAAGVQSFVREEGEGDPVVCMHGVPASSFLYRKVLPELADRGLHGVAFDLPGLGLAARPPDFDYTWTGLGRFAIEAAKVLELDRFHLVVHDIGGPVGFEVAAAMPDRIRSLTILNTVVEVDVFRRPWVMEPFAVPIVGELWLATMVKPVFRALMHRMGIGNPDKVRVDDIDAYVDLLKREDNGRAFLQIMKGFERTRHKRDLYVSTVRNVPYPVQILWGADDPALKLEVQGEQCKAAAELADMYTVPAKHFLQEDQAPAVAERIARLARRA
jgi:pimeloyl-ACP methyl ester carboxylesterase